MISTRIYLCLWNEGGANQNKQVPVKELLTVKNDAMEFIYAMQDKADEILDLKFQESMYFQFNRDDQDSKGIIKRIS